ncbi:glycosyltransferase family 2 protein [Halobellus captivus]|uniref:glycosyltransferase family 2 protein n=1 Tax=Halobellus captivus TaxID=2592614 RepID=UPI0011A44B84|nr:glycosyltransferase family 2 protein [Halobellus captivus]
MYREQTIGAVIPAYNEEAHIGDVIETLPEFVDRAYIIDDGSTDGTWEEIQRHAETVNERSVANPPVTDGGTALEPRVVPIQHEENRGVGGAIKTGYLRALDDGVDVTAVMGGDGQTEPDIVKRIVDPVARGDAEYAKGNRLLSGDRDDMPRLRQVGNFTLTFLTKIASGYWKLMDPQNGSTAISHEALDAVGIEEMYEGYGYCNDLLIRLNTHGMRVADVSRRAVYKDETSHIRYRTYVPKVSAMLLRGFIRRLHTKYFVKDFHPIPLVYYLGAFSAGSGLLAALTGAVSEDRGLIGGFLLFVIGCLSLLLAMTFDLDQNKDLEVLLYDREAEK